MSIIYFLIIFTIIVVIHELGHFLFARIFGVQVDFFAVGFGPKLFSWKGKKGTEYKINLIPIGGYVRMAGEDPTAIEELPPEEKKTKYYAKPAWQRFFIAFAGPLFSLIAGYIILAVSASIWGLPVIGIDRVDINSPAYESGLRDGDVVLKINGSQIFSSNQFSNAVLKMDNFDVTILRDGKEMDFKITPQTLPVQYNMVLENSGILSAENSSLKEINGVPIGESDFKEYMDKTAEYLFDSNIINATLRGFEKYEARRAIGIVYGTLSNTVDIGSYPFENGDRIVKVGDFSVEKGMDFYALIKLLNFPISENEYTYLEVRGDNIISEKSILISPEIQVTVERDGRKLTFDSSAETISNGLLSSSFEKAYKNYFPQNTFDAVKLGFMHGNNLLSRMGEILSQLFSGGTKLSEFAGPIGLVNMVGQASQGGMENLLFLTALITLNLGLFNLLPLPALDGGRIIFNIIEMIRRKQINPVIEGYIHAAGFFILMGMMIYVTYFDIMRLFK